ncbi:unnamed protein product [Mycena citricolor]|uniref:Uncharacterized protein n=2 Tax=Mycena citricolor TaxID=2018698 RepID=A0AAD2JZ09_9AGAR|nr:unnamed protein product [Mycena citricolor]
MSRSTGGHPPGCLCSHCHLKLFPRGPGDRIILPTPGPSPQSPQFQHRLPAAPPARPQSTAPGEYRPSHRRGHSHAYGYAQEAPPPVPPLPMASRGSGDARYGMEARGAPVPEPARYHQAPPIRPASAMAHHSRSRTQSTSQPSTQQPHHQPAPASSQSQTAAQQPEWTAPKLKWVQKKERVSHFTPPSQYQGTSFRQYVHEGISQSTSKRGS